jgi:hypothetical protein
LIKIGLTVKDTVSPVADRTYTIQHIYINTFSSLLEYKKVFQEKEIDWTHVIGSKCAICSEETCSREITPYFRTIVSLFPYMEITIPVCRFLCRKEKKTYSLLPHQIAPYHRYTVSSMTLCLLIAYEQRFQHQKPLSRLIDDLPEDCADCNLTTGLILTWLTRMVLSLRRAKAALKGAYPWPEACFRTKTLEGMLNEIHPYILAIVEPYASPKEQHRVRRLDQMIAKYAHQTGTFLFGTPSQEQRRGRG